MSEFWFLVKLQLKIDMKCIEKRSNLSRGTKCDLVKSNIKHDCLIFSFPPPGTTDCSTLDTCKGIDVSIVCRLQVKAAAT